METMTGSPSSAPRSGLSAVAESLPTTSLSSGAGEVDTGLGDLEVVLPDLESTVRWFQHGYPTPLARWHHHPEIEFHLIVASHGQMMAGDRTVDFAPGQVTLMGPDLPHNWLSDLGPGECLEKRDVLCQVLPERVARAAQILPELSDFNTLVERSRRGHHPQRRERCPCRRAAHRHGWSRGDGAAHHSSRSGRGLLASTGRRVVPRRLRRICPQP